jgi:NAD(P)H dehydrogenase (quinone)
MKGLVVFYSMYGHVHAMAEAVAEAMRRVCGAEVVLRRVPETVPAEILKESGVYEL